MSATGRNIMKLLSGVALGAGIGALASKFSERAREPADEPAPPGESVGETLSGWKERLRGRWEAAQVAGDVAQQAKEAELRGHFREKTNDPDALLHEEPVRST